MGKDLVTRTASKLYEERHLTDSANGIDNLLFSTIDESTSANFRMDRYISSPFGMAYRNADNQSLVRQFNAGTTELVEVPRGSEKTPIDEDLREAVAVGNEPTDSQAVQLAQNTKQILGDHVEGNNMTKWFQALNTVVTSIFQARGAKGADIDLDYDLGRNVSQSITYDFTAGGATMAEAMTELSLQLDATGTPKSNRIAILGADWVSKWSTDTGVQAYLDANSKNELLEQDIFEKKFMNVEGLFVLGRYRPPGATSPFWVLSYEPGVQYVAYKGATPAPFMPATKCVTLSLDDKTYNIRRGVDAYNDSKKVVRAVGDLVVDSFTTDDPIVTYIRSQFRRIFVYGNIDHTAVSTGTFA